MLWRIQVFPWNDPTEKSEMKAAKNRKINLRLAAPSTMSFSIDGRHPQALLVNELITDAIVSMDGQDIARMRAGNAVDTVEATGYGVAFNFNDYRAVLARRKLRSTMTLAYTTEDVADICIGMIDDVQALANGDYGIVSGVGNPSGVVRTNNLVEGQYVGKEIQAMSETYSGYDWDINAALELDIYAPARGANNGVALEYGKSIAKFTRSRTPSSFANDVLVTGRAGTASSNATSGAVASDPAGRWDAVASYPDITVQDTLDDRGLWLVDRSSVIEGTYSVVLRPGFWEGPDHIGLGDTVRNVVRVGRISDDFEARVLEIEVQPFDDGGEEVRLVF